LDYLELERVPERLREKVEQYLTQEPDAKILTVSPDGQKVYLEKANILTVFWFVESLGVMKDSMNAGDIDIFLQHSSWFGLHEKLKYGIKEG
jgi:hypothetical protein